MMMLCAVLAVILLSGPEAARDRKIAAEISADADRVYESGEPANETVKGARITSRRSDFDRKEGLVMFEGDVLVRYDRDYTLAANRLFVFLEGSNQLARIVAVGGVSITNEARVGTCALATFRRKSGEIEMFGDDKGVRARFRDGTSGGSELDGTRIKFWLDSEQVEVEDSQISVESGGGRKLL